MGGAPTFDVSATDAWSAVGAVGVPGRITAGDVAIEDPQGLIARLGHEPVTLALASVSHIRHQGGTVLGSSRGCQDPGDTVDHERPPASR